MEEIFLIKYLKDSSCKNNLEYTINGKLFSYLRPFIWILFYFIFEYSLFTLEIWPIICQSLVHKFWKFLGKAKVLILFDTFVWSHHSQKWTRYLRKGFWCGFHCCTLLSQTIHSTSWSMVIIFLKFLFFIFLFLNFLLILTAKHI